MLLPYFTNTLCFVADVIASADVIAMFCVLFLLLRLMFLPHYWMYNPSPVAGGIATTWWYMADVIARWLMELPLQGGGWQMLWPAGRCYLPGQFFNFSSEMLNRTSSHMCGRWYLPIFLFRHGSLTLIYRASLMVLIRFWSSLPTILKCSGNSTSHWAITSANSIHCKIRWHNTCHI